MWKHLDETRHRWMPIAAVLLMVIAAAMLAHTVQRQIAGAWFTRGIHPDILNELENSLDDQKVLSDLDPDDAIHYRQRFDGLATLVHRLRILEHNRADIVERYELLTLAGFVLGLFGLILFASHRRTLRESRLGHLQNALTALADGRTDLDLGERRRDTIGRIAQMVERTSRRMERDHKRLRALQNLSSWQESARRHAHEMRTPLTGARLELTRLRDAFPSPGHEVFSPQANDAGPEKNASEIVEQATRSIEQELERLARFTQQFTSFARLPRPRFEQRNLRTLVAEFVDTFDSAWPELALEVRAGQAKAGETVDSKWVEIDPDMVRQVLVNLCDNAALAVASAKRSTDGAEAERTPLVLQLEHQREQVILDVIDRGPGVADAVRDRLFEPYTTTRSIGEGMGLGLAICRKILLDHGGDLELLETSSQGTTFRLSFPSTSALPTQHPAASLPERLETAEDSP